MGDKKITEVRMPGRHGKVVAMLGVFNSNLKPLDFEAFPDYIFDYFPLPP